MKKISVYRTWAPFVCLLLIHACGGAKVNQPPEPQPRYGLDLTAPLPASSSDSRPSLSRDGSNIVFISTRDSKHSRIYKTPASIGAGLGISGPLMSTGIVSNGTRLEETQAWITPDGLTVFFTATDLNSPSLTTLYSVDFASGTQISNAITSTSGAITSLVFSTDSKVFAFTNLASPDAPPAVSIGLVASPTTLVATGNTEEEQTAFFLNTGAPYSLITYSKPQTGVVFNNVSFGLSLATPTSTPWGSGFSPNLLLSGPLTFSLGQNSGGGSQAYFTQDISTQQLLINLNGSSNLLSQTSVPPELKQRVLQTVATADATGSNWGDASWTKFGTSINSVSSSQASPLSVYVSVERHLCNGASGHDSGAVSGTAMALANLGVSPSTFSWQLPMYNVSGDVWALGSDPCNIPNGYQPDFRVLSAVMNAGATAISYRIVYVSSFQNSTNYNKQSQIFIFDVNAKETAITLVQ